jgi:TetR/AcrR family tetracycline transcriptional repressor
VAAAIALLDEEGIAKLSTRRLAERLGVRSPTLYWHVRNKAELLDLVAEELCADAFVIDETRTWRDQLTEGMHQFRGLVRSHRDVTVLLRDSPVRGPNRLRHVEATLRILLRSGLSEHDVAAFSRLLIAHALSETPATAPLESSVQDTVDSRPDFPSIRRVTPSLSQLSDDDVFDLGVTVILDAIEDRVRS